jgi:hypothetical protein
MVSSGLLRRVTLVRNDVSEDPGASFIRVTKIGELGTTQAATSNRRTLRRNSWYFFAAYVLSLISGLLDMMNIMKNGVFWDVSRCGSCN